MALITAIVNRDLTDIVTGFQYLDDLTTHIADDWRTSTNLPYTYSDARYNAIVNGPHNNADTSTIFAATRYDRTSIPTGSDWTSALAGPYASFDRDRSVGLTALDYRRGQVQRTLRAGRDHGGGFTWYLVADAADVDGLIDPNLEEPTLVEMKAANPSPPPELITVIVTYYRRAQHGIGKKMEVPGRAIAIANSGGDDRIIETTYTGLGQRIRKLRVRSLQIVWTSLEDATAEAQWGVDIGAYNMLALKAARAELLSRVT